VAGELTKILRDIETEMITTLNLNYRAMQTLGVEENGWCSKFYSKEAEELWADQLSKHPEDPETIHHLAILHHARAFDLEYGSDPTQADKDWEKALYFWKMLVDHNDFWKAIDTRLPKGSSASVARGRDRFWERLLSVHFGIAYSSHTASHRAKFHIKQALKSGLPAEKINAVRVNTYERFTGELPNEVWSGNVNDQNVLKEACNRIRRILEIDPECITALHDVLRLQEQLISLQLYRKQEFQEDEAIIREIYTELRDQAELWLPYFDHLLNDRGSIQEDVRETLLLWLRNMGYVKQNLQDFSGSFKLFDKGILIASDDDSSRKELLNAAALSHALYARDLANNQSSEAMPVCRNASARSDQSVSSLFVLAQAYYTLKDYDSALKECERGISLVSEDTCEDTSEAADREMLSIWLQDFKMKVKIQKVIHKAQAEMEEEKFREAILILTEAINSEGDISWFYFLRCRCFISTEDIKSAKMDLSKLESLAKSEEAAEFIVIIRKQTDDLLTNKYLTPAQEAMNNKEFRKAIELFSKAVAQGFDELNIYYQRCWCYTLSKNYNEAVADLNRCETLAVYPNDKKVVKELREYLLPAGPKDDTAVEKLAEEIYNVLCSSFFPSYLEVRTNDCMIMLEQLIREEVPRWTKESPQRVVDKFVEVANQNPDAFTFQKDYGTLVYPNKRRW
jgi:tetratricopeptide (TPR) repeat protein